MEPAHDKLAVRIETFDDRYAASFDRLNREWLTAYGLFEECDRKHLEHPRASIIDRGGEIFLAIAGDEVVGTCAVIPLGERSVELAKLAVARDARGHGLGRRLTNEALSWARRHGAQRVVLVSSTKLRDALQLYERMGFQYRPLPEDPGYATADIFMELEL